MKKAQEDAMPDALDRIVNHLVGRTGPHADGGAPVAVDASAQLREEAATKADTARNLNAAFLIALCGPAHPLAERARRVLDRRLESPEGKGASLFFQKALGRVHEEIRSLRSLDASFDRRIEDLAAWLDGAGAAAPSRETEEKTWSVFFPEGTGIRGAEESRVRELRETRGVRILSLNPKPITDPGREVLFTANALLTVPSRDAMREIRGLSSGLLDRLRPVLEEPQQTWYDHPVQIGADPESNEILYGLRGLDEAMAFEKRRGTLDPERRAVCLLSVSVTHAGLHALARGYIREEIERFGGFEHLHVFVFTEEDTRRLAKEVLRPAAARYLGGVHPAAAFPAVFGVDGEYGRHYSFLKAAAPLWQVLVDSSVRATFKIDLDQVFPQDALVAETGASALEHLATPLWGAAGEDAFGEPVDLGLLAGALVNDRDIHRGLFTPDVPFPERPPLADERLFFSLLPQALSTEAEMMTRYGSEEPNGRSSCIQRIHVTGGTTGALVSALRRHRPFTPSFVGRAEDQAFLLSCLSREAPRPAYLHQPGLIMRHDKDSFAVEAVRAAQVSKLTGDDIRILLFSAYGRMLSDPLSRLKKRVDPFTGCFISRLPKTLVLLRSAVRAASFFSLDRKKEATQLVYEGTERIRRALSFTEGKESPLERAFEEERKGWRIYYDVLDALEQALERGDGEARKLRAKARRIVGDCALTP